MEALAAAMGLSPGAALFAIGVGLAAGVVRGFSGFALSALLMASLVVILPPVELIGVCLILEGVATLLMGRGAIGEANKKMVLGLVAGVLVGAPIGLTLITSVPPETAKIIALSLILVLALAQLSGVRPAWLSSRPGLLGSGVAAGIVQGTAASGGLVVALYMLARETPAPVMRASLVFYLMLAIMVNGAYYISFGLMTEVALMRGLILAVPAVIGVLLGARMFSPRFQPYYRPFCLWLLTGLALAGLARAAM